MRLIIFICAHDFQSVQGEVSLSTRSLLELDQYIQQQFPDYAVNCEMCKKLCLKVSVKMCLDK